MLHRTLHLSSEYFLLVHPRKSSIPKCILNISWQPPVDPFVSLNIDGSTLGNPGYAGGGGVIRDSQGRWIIGFPPHIGLTTNNIAELWAVRQRLYMVRDAGIIILNIKVDSTFSYKFLTSPGDMALALAPLICDCRILLDRKWMVCLHHTYHEVNRVADRLAKRGREQSSQLKIYSHCPSFVSCSYIWARLQKCTPRECSMVHFVNRHQLQVSNGHTWCNVFINYYINSPLSFQPSLEPSKWICQPSIA